MTLLNTIIATSVVALGFVAQNAAPVNALAAGNPHAARHLGHSTNHGGVLKRKRSSHKLRKRCVAPSPSGSSNSPAPTDSSNNGGGDQGTNNSNNNNNNNSNNNGNVYVPPVNNAPACSSGKMILAWGPDMSTTYMPSAITGKTCYYYNWSPWPTDPSLTGGLHFVPMFWSDKQAGEYQQNVIDNPNTPYAVLAMNEVNQDGQAKMDVGTGIGQWYQYIMPMRARGAKLGSPSVTSAPDGKDWLVQFTNALPDSDRPDFYAVHWYGTSVNDFISYLTDIHNTFGKDVWVTEFACTDFSGQGLGCDVWNFAQKAKAFLDSTSWIGAYAPFAWVNGMSGVNEANRLIDQWGNISDLGKYWIA